MWRHNFHVVWKTTDKWQAVCLSGGWQEVNRHIFKMSSLNRSVWLGNADQEVKYGNWKMTNFPTFPKHGGHHRGTRCGPRCGTQLRFDCGGSGQWGCSSQTVSPSVSLLLSVPARNSSLPLSGWRFSLDHHLSPIFFLSNQICLFSQCVTCDFCVCECEITVDNSR